MDDNYVLLTISGCTAAFGLYQGLMNMRKTRKAEDKNEASRTTSVLIKLENIGNGILEIKNEVSSLKTDNKELHERIVKVEESTKAAHKRIDIFDQFCGRTYTTKKKG